MNLSFRIKSIIVIAWLLIALPLVVSAYETLTGKVVKVKDGDTITILQGSNTRSDYTALTKYLMYY